MQVWAVSGRAAAALAGAVTLAAGLAGGAAQAQGLMFDGQFGYEARDEVTGQDDPDGSLGHDGVRLKGGLSWSFGDGRMRAALEAGMIDESGGNGEGSRLGGAELEFARRVGNRRYGIYGRVQNAEALSTTTELGYGIQHLGSRFDLRGLVGLQLVADADAVGGRAASSAFGLGELGLYVTPDWLISAGLQGDADGAVWALGTEYRPRSWGGFSLYANYAEAFDEYRGVQGHDTLSAGIRWMFGAGGTLRAKRQANIGVLTRRFVEVQ